MQVFLDDRALDTEADDLGAALRAGGEAARRQGRMVVEVKADGIRLSEDVLASPGDYATPVREIRLTSADPVAVVTEAMHVAGQLLADAKSRQGDAAVAFTTGDIAGGAEQLKRVVAAWQSVQNAVAQAAGVLGVDLETMTFEAGDGERRLARDQITALAGNLNGLLEALGRQDWSAGADLLDYELASAADRWGALIRRLSALATERAAGGAGAS